MYGCKGSQFSHIHVGPDAENKEVRPIRGSRRTEVADMGLRMRFVSYFVAIDHVEPSESKWELWLVYEEREREPVKFFSHEYRHLGNQRKQAICLAAALNADCKGNGRTIGRPTRRELHKSDREQTKTWTRLDEDGRWNRFTNDPETRYM